MLHLEAACLGIYYAWMAHWPESLRALGKAGRSIISKSLKIHLKIYIFCYYIKAFGPSLTYSRPAGPLYKHMLPLGPSRVNAYYYCLPKPNEQGNETNNEFPWGFGHPIIIK